ncbi:MAG: phosphoribosylformylglycinamidine cyclo-ligase [Ignavibacterium sp.]|nr:phosphoribosylformylglycinamidine cyclo-ligase [Ignavibacterium sp.]MDW8374854.1 phosphoribosylformylglycinamidine cyclo-ligase [Ignavibacteriales bacterium]
MSETYKKAGVDISAGDKAVQKIKKLAKSTFNKNVLSDIGLFGGFYELNLSNYKNPVLVSSVDGVGTKLKIAIEKNIHNTIGQDLVNHCVNDIAVCGAEPLFFLDYFATGKLNPDVAEKIVEGFAIACRENNCALIGGETAEMPGLYSESDYDIAGTIVGIVEKTKIIDGSKIKPKDIIIGVASNGLHTNGYSLVRKVLLKKYNLDDFIPELNNHLWKELLRVHKSYLSLIKTLKEEIEIKGLAHITGGGIVSNTMRIIPDGLKINIFWGNWTPPQIFQLIKKVGDLRISEMRKVFNMGIGLCIIISPKDERKLFDLCHLMNEHALLIGEVV